MTVRVVVPVPVVGDTLNHPSDLADAETAPMLPPRADNVSCMVCAAELVGRKVRKDGLTMSCGAEESPLP